ncbi:class I SAM-dependent methyltransferase [Dactylosporangium sp. NPDC049525]|uniref:class I SAM-dependent methyltransferase n=1 Tax=Dactylosporangium sp. NPDC049525 TaxID=3154730 RepID=UPI003439CD21
MTRDGCPVDLYPLLPPTGEPALIHAAIPPGAEILELGCGAGRLTHPLIDLGHPVTAVDNSADMLAHVRGPAGLLGTVLADIETLDLDRRFPAVLLASHLLNTPDDRLRGRLLAACRRHLAADGRVLIQWLPPAWFDRVFADMRPVTGRIGRIEVTDTPLSHDGTVLQAICTYRLEDGTVPPSGTLPEGVTLPEGGVWSHRFATRRLSRADLHAALAGAGLRFERHLDAGRHWLTAAV